MRILIELWILGIGLDLLKFRHEMRSTVLFGLHAWVMKKQVIVEVYRPLGDRTMQFNLQLPFFRLNNDMVRRVKTDAEGLSHAVSVVTGKILWFTIGGEK